MGVLEQLRKEAGQKKSSEQQEQEKISYKMKSFIADKIKH